VVAEWRRVNLGPLETAARSPARTVGELVPELIRKLGIPKRRAEAELVKAWNSLVDPTVTAHAQPSGLRNGTLFVKVDSSVWLSEIVRYRRPEILERLQHCFGRELVSRISFRLG
jgi:predicted nucleic acid-binding Zn ribbon protein